MSNMNENHTRWMEEAKKEGAIYFLDVCDSWDYSHYPVMVMKEEELTEKQAYYNNASMQSVYATVKVV